MYLSPRIPISRDSSDKVHAPLARTRHEGASTRISFYSFEHEAISRHTNLTHFITYYVHILHREHSLCRKHILHREHEASSRHIKAEPRFHVGLVAEEKGKEQE